MNLKSSHLRAPLTSRPNPGIKITNDNKNDNDNKDSKYSKDINKVSRKFMFACMRLLTYQLIYGKEGYNVQIEQFFNIWKHQWKKCTIKQNINTKHESIKRYLNLFDNAFLTLEIRVFLLRSFFLRASLIRLYLMG